MRNSGKHTNYLIISGFLDSRLNNSVARKRGELTRNDRPDGYRV
jgi:hypothetical protein